MRRRVVAVVLPELACELDPPPVGEALRELRVEGRDPEGEAPLGVRRPPDPMERLPVEGDRAEQVALLVVDRREPGGDT